MSVESELSEKTTLLEAITAVSSSLDTTTLLTRLAEKMAQAIGVTSAYISNWDAETGLSTILAEYYSPQASDRERVSKLGLTYDLIGAYQGAELHWLNKPLISQIDDPNLPAWEHAYMNENGCQSLLSVPLVINGKTIGYAELWESRTKRDFTQTEINLCQGIAQQAAIAISNAQRYQAEARRRREAEILNEAAGYLTGTLDLQEVFERVLDAVRLYLSNIQSCSLSLLEQNGRVLRIYMAWNERQEFSTLPVGEAIAIKETFYCQLTLESGEPIAVADLSSQPFSNERTKTLAENGLRALLYVPLMIQDKPLGILHIHVWHQRRDFSSEEIALCQGVANQAAIAIESANLFASKQDQLHLAQTLQKVGSLLTTSLNINDVYEQLFDLLQEVAEFDHVSIQLIDETTHHLHLAAARGLSDVEMARRHFRENTAHLLSQVPVPPGWNVIPDTHSDPGWLIFPSLEPVLSWVGAALQVKNKRIGTITMTSKMRNAYDDRAGETLMAFANQAAIAIENTRLHEETIQQANELSVLHQLALATAATMDVDELLRQTTEMIAASLYPDVFGFVMMDEDGQVLRPHPSFHGMPKALHGAAIPFDNSIVGWVAQSGEPYVTNNVKEDPLYYNAGPASRSEIAVPVLVRKSVIGVINVESPKLNAYSDRDVHFLVTLAGTVAAALERAKLYETLRAQADNLAGQVAEQTAELEAERDRTLAILDSAGEGILLTDTEARILYVNPALEQQSGYSRHELLSQTPRILWSETSSKSAYRKMRETVLAHQRWSGELQSKRKDGTLYDITLTVTPIMDADINIVGYVSIQSDITRLKEVERLKSEFISNVSHELRTPLTSIKTYVSLLQRGKPENHARYFAVLHQESDRLARLIKDLLDIARLDTELIPDPNAQTDFYQSLETLLEKFTELAHEKELALTSFVSDSLGQQPSVKIGKHHLENVLSNLLDNAVAFTPPGGEIHLTADIEPDMEPKFIQISVKDNGPGIQLDEQERIFDRFFRGQQAFAQRIAGTGLGLAIAREIVERYEGFIEVESEPGNGACFTVSLPLVI